MLPIVQCNITYLSRADGGRDRLPDTNFGRYMPHLVVQPPDVRTPKVIDGNKIIDDYLGVRFLSGPTVVTAGTPYMFELALMYHPQVSYDALREGATFTAREGGKIVGYGTVLNRTDAVSV